MIWGSDRAGYRSHGSWGAEDDVYIMFFDVDAYDRFLMSNEDVARLDELEKAEKEKKEKAEKAQANSKNKKDKKADDAADKEVKELVLDLENAKDRVVRLTVNSSHLSDAILDKKGEVLYYIASFEGAGDLWKHDLKEDKTEIVLKNIGRGALLTDKEMKYIYTMGMGGIVRMEFGKSDKKNISYEAIFNYKPAQERQYMFDHIWRQVNEKFYDPTIRGIDWAGYKANYEKFLPYINNNYDFQDLLSELLGELNGSHTGARYYPSSSALSVASLGLFYDDTFEGNGMKIKEIIPKSNLTKKKNEVTAGCIIEKIDGTPVENNADYLLAGKVGKNILLSIYNPATGKRFEIAIKGISQAAETELLYSRWVERNRKIVETESGGRLGYVHIKGMDSQSFRTLYSEALGKYRNVEALIVDTRHNGGGWLHDDVVTLLGAKEYTRYTPRGQYIGSDPYNKFTKPSCMLVCEDNYSNAHGTPWLYKELGIGKVIGTPVPGTMTAVWWETQIDNSIVFGIPQVGSMDNRGQYLENQQLEPDILIYNKPEDVLNGKDAQLEGAIQEMLKEIGPKK
jgi:C-terminal processing protease CtpA/Prc